MAEKIKDSRIRFPKGKQKAFIENIEKEFSVEQMAKWCGRSERTVRDWRREKFLINEKSLKILCEKSKQSWPKDITMLDKYWYAHEGAKLGWEAVISKYGEMPKNEKYRKQKWYEWWEKEGRFKSSGLTSAPIKIKKPKYSKSLAEFVGIMLGDGGISNQQVTVTLHSKDDKKYGVYVKNLMENLFGVYVGIHERKDANACIYAVSRVELVRFCENNLGLVRGNKIKKQVDIPKWIMGDKDFEIACLRGLVDTDGSIFIHRYRVKSKEYSYKKLSFTSYSEPLRNSVFKIMRNTGLNPRLAGRDVRLDSKHDMKIYFDTISSNNPKHLKKYNN
ncbi:MAG: hypothetical protein WDZ40_02275 [Candidatus Spechtbacterales bacterium]